VTPDCRICPIVIFSGRFIAGWPLGGQPGARATWTARAGPAELRAGGRKRFGCDDNTTDGQRTESRLRDARAASVVRCYRGARQPAASASSAEQNHRLPLLTIFIFAYHRSAC
jgi:hypothetical protein